MTADGYTRFTTGELDSISGLDVPDACGLYVLNFGDGIPYVGQTTNIVRRYAAHRRHRGRIESVDFRPVPRAELDAAEVELIHYFGSRGPLRNILHARETYGPSELDVVVTESEQLAWLNSNDPFAWPGVVVPEVRARRARARARRERLRHAEFERHVFAAGAMAVLRDYVALTIPRPAQTQERFWSLSALPGSGGGTRLSTVSVGKMETLFLYHDQDESRAWLGGVINVSDSELDDATWARIDAIAGVRVLSSVGASGQLQPSVGSYESGGGDVASLNFELVDGRFAYEQLMAIPAVRRAARTLIVRLMRKGSTLQARWHNARLADAVLAAT